MAEIRALYADEDGNILDAPKGFMALARTGTEIVELSPDDLIPLPESADLMFLPDRLPLARYEDEIMPIMGNAVAAILPAGYTRLYMPPPSFRSSLSLPLQQSPCCLKRN